MRKTVAPILSLFNKKLFFFMAAMFLAACVSKPPYEEYSLARTAMRAAEEADSAKYSPAHWLQAESAYRAAEQAYKLNKFGQARDLFIKARLSAEKAENQTRLKKFESGDVFQ